MQIPRTARLMRAKSFGEEGAAESSEPVGALSIRVFPSTTSTSSNSHPDQPRTIMGSRESKPLKLSEEDRQQIIVEKKAPDIPMAGETSGSAQPASSSASSSKPRDACIFPHLRFSLTHLPSSDLPYRLISNSLRVDVHETQGA